jgi:hypothetical protein
MTSEQSVNESILYYGGMAIVVVVLIWIGTARDRRTHAAMRSFAARNGLDYRPQRLLKGIAAEISGPYQGWSIVVGSFFVSRYQKGIGPAPKESQLEARLELPEGMEPDPVYLRTLLRPEGMGYSDRWLRICLPQNYLKALKYEEIEQAAGRLIAVAEKVRAKGAEGPK